MSRIETVISDIEAFLDNCSYLPLSSTYIKVDKNQMDEFLAELRLKIPDEIKKYQKIINNKDSILADANEQAQAIINEAKAQSETIISEHEIMQRAYAEANNLISQASFEAKEMLENATEQANAIQDGAFNYTDDMLAQLQNIVGHAIKENREKFTALDGELTEILNVVNNNRAELNADSQISETQAMLNEAANEDDMTNAMPTLPNN